MRETYLAEEFGFINLNVNEAAIFASLMSSSATTIEPLTQYTRYRNRDVEYNFIFQLFYALAIDGHRLSVVPTALKMETKLVRARIFCFKFSSTIPAFCFFNTF